MPILLMLVTDLAGEEKNMAESEERTDLALPEI